jgi:flagellin
MAQVVNTNIASLNAQRNLNTSQGSLNTALQRLSSGLRVNSAKDDAAGLAIATRMTSQSRGMSVAIRNANDGISMAQTAEAGLGVLGDHLQRMRELAVQAANGTLGASDRSALNAEFAQLRTEIARVIGATQFNGKTVLAGGLSGVAFQVGSGVGGINKITVSVASLKGQLSATKLGSVGISAGNASKAMSLIATALDAVNSGRAKLGAVQSRFEGVVSQLSSAVENTEAAKSRIMDTDYASETAKLSRAQILQQAGTAMLSQANALPQTVLSLIR